MIELPPIGWLIAFGAGLLSFLSPCVLPLLPGYLSYISGVSVDELAAPRPKQRWALAGRSALFVLGFTLVFVLLGTSATLAGGWLSAYRNQLTIAAGVAMVLMGLLVLGLVRLPLLHRELRFRPLARSLGPAGPLVLGMAFAFGWTPCIGPVLASILLYAGTAETTLRGTLLLLAYSAGLGVPFILSGLLFGRVSVALPWLRRHYRLVEIASGLLLIAMGVLFLTGRITYFSLLLQRLYYGIFG